ncbi:MAG: hypothetical protein A3B44_02875 [Candidatus Levybacteria bacterium RIFCSPLOWO2_01_FULL_38_21]|nr:MAG: hypothetical protein A3B44_02875 [Candidatus Levybacteria bacterium RIFCSPLOWO2_01_FULL_38_21]
MRKTRKQKIIADLHRQLYTLKSREASSLKSEEAPKRQEIPSISSADTKVYSYLIKDISKTAVVTTAIIIGQFIFFFLLKNHLVKIPGLNY